ncbi:hypothetical protein C3B44_06660 [Corynebacterium yudongzhengii]|uniref:Uncharacterized protein n=1 Tax=Corynebacterium yudongzhengii TaxID=2080740 RepID=A0A2U1T996_9CORY|nr:hypothetical protein [Corynebacterium yudongzhengii]AWB82072.1 hypothetical protein C3B44_06660 [Corynebacterium yudongzhengii]PWC02576.1 hypothetical protein DF222_01130 [Corynebacterium yudongzhengii]
MALAYGDRYAADQFVAQVPADLRPCHLVAAGGVAGVATEMHAKLIGPTEIEPIGLLADHNGIVNLLACAPYANLPVLSAPRQRPRVIAVLGTLMNSGKSTVMSCAINGLMRAGKDRMHYLDAGAAEAIDLTDFGYATTFKLNFEAIRALSVYMVDTLGAYNDIVVVESTLIERSLTRSKPGLL